MSFRFHVLGLPHTRTSREFCACAYTAKVWKFIDMMGARGHTLFHYGNEGSIVSCEHVDILTEAERSAFFPYDALQDQAPDYLWDAARAHWLTFNARVVSAIRERIQPRDFILTLTGGGCSQPVAAAFPAHMTVEYGIGYYGTFSKYRCFESHGHREWMHGRADSKSEDYHDAVVPNYFDVREFPPPAPRDYYLFVGRIIPAKGWTIALQTVEAIGGKLLLAGQGDPGKLPKWAKFLGPVDIAQRGKLMSGAIATFAPTTYREPFGGVAVEAQLCGTPAITTDHGAFVETVAPEWRAANFREFVAAAQRAARLTLKQRHALRAAARARYGFDGVAPLYERYFQRLYDLWGKGWYQREPLVPLGSLDH